MKLKKKIKPKIPRKLKKVLIMSRPYWCNIRLESHYQHIYNPCLHKDRSFYDKYVGIWKTYWGIEEHNMTPEELCETFGRYTKDMVGDWNNVKLRKRVLVI